MATENAGTAAALFDVRDPAFRQDPYPFYARQRETAPISWNPETRLWRLTRYADVFTALRDARFVANDRWYVPTAPMLPAVEPLRREMLALRGFASHWLIGRNPPMHPRLRAVLAGAFTPRVIEQLRPRIEALVGELLDAVSDCGEMEVVHDLAVPLPVMVIGALLGLPTEDRVQFKVWSDTLIAWGTYAFHPDPVQCVQAAARSLDELRPYFAALIRRRRQEPGDDLISLLVTSDAYGTDLDEAALISNCLFLLQAGHETTTALLANGLLALLRHPDQLERLAQGPALLDSAVEELLRYDSPVVYALRVARESVELGGHRFEAGQGFTLLLGAANRDPDQFADPDRLDVGRRDNRHLAFGFGPHFCLGAPLARMEAAVVIATLLRRFTKLELATDALTYGSFGVFRNPQALPIRFALRA